MSNINLKNTQRCDAAIECKENTKPSMYMYLHHFYVYLKIISIIMFNLYNNFTCFSSSPFFYFDQNESEYNRFG